MQRRRFLHAMVAGAGLAAGCIGSSLESGQSSPTSTDGKTSEPPATTREPTTTTQAPDPATATTSGQRYELTELSLESTTDQSGIEFTASIRDRWVTPDSAGALELSLTNSSQETLQVFTGTVPPFGLVRAEHVDNDGGFLLWRDYEEEGCARFNRDALSVCDIGVVTEIDPQETISRRYEVLPSTTKTHPEYTAPPAPGEYRISQDLSYSGGADSSTADVSIEANFRLEPVAGDDVPENSTK